MGVQLAKVKRYTRNQLGFFLHPLCDDFLI